MSLLIDLLRGSHCTLMNKMKKNLQSNILLLPALIAGFFCYLFPILIAFGKSFFLGTGTDFVGIQNYVDLFENEAFSLAVRNLFHLWAIIVPVNLVIGIFIAEVYIKLRKEKLCLFFLVPSILPAACVVTIASSILQKSPSQWGETPVAFYVFLIIVLWKTLGFSILIRFLYKGIIIKHNKTEPTYTKTSLFLCEKRRFFMARTEKGVVTTI